MLKCPNPHAAYLSICLLLLNGLVEKKNPTLWPGHVSNVLAALLELVPAGPQPWEQHNQEDEGKKHLPVAL